MTGESPGFHKEELSEHGARGRPTRNRNDQEKARTIRIGTAVRKRRGHWATGQDLAEIHVAMKTLRYRPLQKPQKDLFFLLPPGPVSNACPRGAHDRQTLYAIPDARTGTTLLENFADAQPVS
ncbi:MAG: hypothetical protein M1297_07535 [Nitrospirae bacterium]|nr:hypothetical protein [Nitrospirota bacterium]